ncbi:MAG: tetratricopeptide repeat protein [Janthinobacterium lividum]
MSLSHPAAALLTILAGAALLTAPARANTAAGLEDLRSGRYAEAIVEWKAAAGSGDATAALLLGVMSDTGQGVPQDYAQALSWYRRAAEAGSPSGMFNVGIMYDAGQGVLQDQAEAARWYERAAAKGFPRAEYNLALMYEDGSGVLRNRRHAIQLFRSAAQHGLTSANTHLAGLGLGPPPSRARSLQTPDPDTVALDEFRRAQAGMLARTPLQAADAVTLFRHAAQHAGTMAQSAQYDLGFCYENGIGVPRDRAQAYGWYMRSMAGGDDAQVKAIAASSARNLERHLTTAERQSGIGQLAAGP